MKDLNMRSSGLPKWALNPTVSVLVRDKKRDDTGVRPCEDGGRSGNDASIGQGCQEALEAGTGRREAALGPPEEVCP